VDSVWLVSRKTTTKQNGVWYAKTPQDANVVVSNWRDRTLNEIAAIELEAEALVAKLNELKERRAKLKKVIYEARTDELRGADSLLVLAADIRPMIKQWIELHDKQYGGGGQLILAERSNVSTRRIRAITNRTEFAGREGRFVTLQTADRLLTAMDMGNRIADLDIVPNGSVRKNGGRVPEPPQSNYYEE
jgi:hypothetical protein